MNDEFTSSELVPDDDLWAKCLKWFAESWVRELDRLFTPPSNCFCGGPHAFFYGGMIPPVPTPKGPDDAKPGPAVCNHRCVECRRWFNHDARENCPDRCKLCKKR